MIGEFVSSLGAVYIFKFSIFTIFIFGADFFNFFFFFFKFGTRLRIILNLVIFLIFFFFYIFPVIMVSIFGTVIDIYR